MDLEKNLNAVTIIAVEANDMRGTSSLILI